MKNMLDSLDYPFSILVVDDDVKITDTISVFMEEEKNIDHTITNDSSTIFKIIDKKQPMVILTDMKMPGQTGLEILKYTKKKYPHIEVILMTAHASAQTAVEAMKEGAYDYIIKPFKMIELKNILEKIVKTRLLEQQNLDLREKLARYESQRIIIGSSEAITKIRDMISMIADNNASVIITGESGTGKSMLAEAIHQQSLRTKAPFVTIECAAIPRDLLESELFGYEKGAFTGAEKQKAGRLEKANGGTLFLDEIGDMNLELQAKILRVLQERELVRVGGNNVIPIDIRIIAATNHDLQQMIKDGLFREDLFYRLNVLPIHIPPLRERKDDLPELIDKLIKRICDRLQKQTLNVSRVVLDKAREHSWPGNIRELENTLERSLIFQQGETLEDILLESDPLFIKDTISLEKVNMLSLPEEGLDLKDLEKILVEKALTVCSNNIKKAASLLKIPQNKIKSILEQNHET